MTDLTYSVLKIVKGDEVQRTRGKKRPHDVREEGTEGYITFLPCTILFHLLYIYVLPSKMDHESLKQVLYSFINFSVFKHSKQVNIVHADHK